MNSRLLQHYAAKFAFDSKTRVRTWKMLGIVSVYVMPQLASLSDPAQWSGFARVFYLICSFIGSWGGFSFYLATFIGVMAIFVSLPLWTGPSRSAVDDYAPWSLYRLTVGGVWLFTLATFMRSGMQLSHILSSMQSSDATSPYLRERVGAIRAQVARGENIGEAMYLCGFNFPDRQLINDFRVYATLPQFKDKLLELSREWLFDGIELIKQKTRILNVVLLVFIIGQMAMIALSVMDIQSQISVQTMGGVK